MSTFILNEDTPGTGIINHKGGVLMVKATGEFGGATIKFVHINFTDTDEVEDSSFTMSAPDTLSTPMLPPGVRYKIKADGVSGTTSINLSLIS